MLTEWNAKSFEFARVESRLVVASFDGGAVTSDAGQPAARGDGPGDWAGGLTERGRRR